MAYKEKDTKKWTAQWFETNARGEKKKRRKRGFETKREALEYERQKKLNNSRSMDMKLSEFMEVYFEDKQNELKERTMKNKRYMMEQHIIPYFGNQMMSEITAGQIIQWQNEMQTKGFSEAYLRMIQNQLRDMTKRLGALAEKYKCAIILIGHMNKASGNKAAYRGMGSIDFFAVARSVLLVGRVEGEPNIRAVVQIKNNLAQFGHPKAFELMERGFKWMGDYEITADEVLGGIAPKANKLEQAKRMLRELAETSNAVQSNEIFDMAEEQGISKRTLENAKKELCIRARKINDSWYWELDKIKQI